MKNIPYKFENYAVADFPVYASEPLNQRHIVTAHYHRDAEIIKVVKGCVKVHVGTTTCILNEGEMIFCVPYIVHEVITESDDAKIRGFVFDTKLLDESVNFNFSRDTHYIFSIDSQKTAELSQVFDELHRVYKERPDTFKLRISAGLLHIAAILTEIGFIMQNNDNSKTLRTAPVIRYIRKNYAQSLSITELAKLINVCNDYFIRIFKKEHGQTPSSYIINFRITEALNLLYENKYSISDIAALTGFSSAGYFTKIFKEKLGVSPLKYRKIHFDINKK